MIKGWTWKILSTLQSSMLLIPTQKNHRALPYDIKTCSLLPDVPWTPLPWPDLWESHWIPLYCHVHVENGNDSGAKNLCWSKSLWKHRLIKREARKKYQRQLIVCDWLVLALYWVIKAGSQLSKDDKADPSSCLPVNSLGKGLVITHLSLIWRPSLSL